MRNLVSTFALYRLPYQHTTFYNNSEARVITSLTDLKEEHFIISPFDTESIWPTYGFSSSKTQEIKDVSELNINIHFNEHSLHISNKEEHHTQVESIVAKIKSGKIQKAVLSRIKKIRRNEEFALEIFDLLCKKYPSAFVYLCQLPDGQVWCGASPETLAKYENQVFSTMALAGTQTINDRNLVNLEWSQKDIEEQVWVQDLIKEKFRLLELNFQYSKTYSDAAGPVAHLRTDFSAKVDINQATQLLKLLHPTPAVCGTPTQQAKKTILQIEKHDRIYYSGYIGLYAPQKFQLNVNLRCMNIDQNNFNLFIGGGITKDSVARDEFEETENKAKTLISVF